MAVPRELIQQWSRDVGRTRFAFGEASVPPTVRETGQVTVAGATEAQIAALEARLGMTLPPSYRAFLAETDGAFGLGYGDSLSGGPTFLLSTDEVAWTRDFDPLYLDLLLTEGVNPSVDAMGVSMFERSEFKKPPPPEAAYLLGEQGVKDGHAVYCLTIGDWGQIGQIVLNPLNIDAAGEWQVLHLDVFGTHQYPSFEAWFVAQVEEAASEWTTPLDELSATLHDPSTQPHAKSGALAALAGWASESAEALEIIKQLARSTQFESWLQFSIDSILFQLGAASEPPITPPPHPQKQRPPGPPTPGEQAVAAMTAMNAASADYLRQADAAVADGDIESAIDLYVLALLYQEERAVDGIRRIDHPKAWEALDELARRNTLPMSMYGYLAAARTRSPLLPATVAEFIGDHESGSGTARGTDLILHCAWLALELQQTEVAADVLLDRWRRGNMYALRALARRRDPRILLDCLSLALSDDIDQTLAGVQMLRDLRNPYCVDDLVQVIDLHDHREIVTTALHAIVMMAADQAQAILARTASRHLDPDLDRVIDVWSAQLVLRDQ